MVEKRVVYVYGFEEEGLGYWPPDIEPIPVTEWPTDGVVIVHADAMEPFKAEVTQHVQADGRLPEVLLFLPSGQAVPAESWDLFDDIVNEGDWRVLQQYLHAADAVRVAEMADELPAAFLQTLDRPVEEVEAEALPLPAPYRRHLAQNQSARTIFNRAIKERLELRHHLLGQELRQAADAMPSSSPLPLLASTWLTIPLTSAIENVASRIRWGVKTLVEACLEAEFQPVSNRVLTRGPASSKPLMDRLFDGEKLQLRRASQDLSIRWDETQQSVQISDLNVRNQQQIGAWRVQLCRGTEVLWEGESMQGRVRMPLPAVEYALKEGADQLVIVQSA